MLSEPGLAWPDFIDLEPKDYQKHVPSKGYVKACNNFVTIVTRLSTIYIYRYIDGTHEAPKRKFVSRAFSEFTHSAGVHSDLHQGDADARASY